jgi:hypothetical protein
MKLRSLPSLYTLKIPSVVFAFLFVSWTAASAWQGHDDNPDYPYIPIDHKTIQYEERPTTDVVGRFAEAVEKGEKNLAWDPKFGYLPSLLKQFDINIDSQTLVFSRTSFQAPRISPAKPRAVFFNDTVSIGSVQDGLVFEVAALDPRQGEIFYTVDMEQQDKPVISRQGIACLQCHYSPASLNIPGIFVSSGYPNADGSPSRAVGAFATDHRIPINQRWGGWYVTGTKGVADNRGNAVVQDPRRPTELSGGRVNLANVDERFDTRRYVTNTSDVVALMTLEHQTRMTNLIIRIGWESRIAMEEGSNNSDEFRKLLDTIAENVVSYMLFAEEAPIREPIEGSSTFTKTFPLRGPRDKQGRSLRDFDLKTRLFLYPLSYMIYSEAFDSLPPMASEAVYRKLHDVLTGKNLAKPFDRLSTEDRRAILEILRDTKPNLPESWKADAVRRNE